MQIEKTPDYSCLLAADEDSEKEHLVRGITFFMELFQLVSICFSPSQNDSKFEKNELGGKSDYRTW